MGRLLKFDEFDSGSFHESRKAVVENTRSDVQRIVSDRVLTLALTTDYLSEAEKVWLELFMKVHNLRINEGSIAESLWDVLKKGVESVENSKIGKAVADKIGQALEGAKKFGAWVADLLAKAWDKMIGYFKEKYAKVLDPLMKKTAEEMKSIKGNIKDEIKSLKETLHWWLKNGLKMFTDAIRGKLSAEITEAVFTYDGDLLTEMAKFDPSKMRPVWEDEEDQGGKETTGEDTKVTPDGEQNGMFSFMNKIAHAIDQIPPFKYLAKLKDVVSGKAEQILGKFSEFTKQMGGPGSFEFVIIAGLVGTAVEQIVERYLLKNAEEVLTSEVILRFIPGAPHIVTILELIALFTIVVDRLARAGELEGQIEHNH